MLVDEMTVSQPGEALLEMMNQMARGEIPNGASVFDFGNHLISSRHMSHMPSFLPPSSLCDQCIR
jgi:hypothetical protein